MNLLNEKIKDRFLEGLYCACKTTAIANLGNYYAKRGNKIAHFKKKKDKIEGRLLYKYPLFISYPRSGSHWVNSIMELYFNRPRLRKGSPSFLDKNRRDWMWIHDHDLNLEVLKKIRNIKNYKFRKVLFLYRNPLDVIYSLIIFKMNDLGIYGEKYSTEKKAFSDEIVKKNILDWIIYHKEYLSNHGDLKFTTIKYENFLNKDTRVKESKKICEHFSYPFNEKKINFFFEKFGKVNFAKYRKIADKDFKKKEEIIH
ncbi:sulfotransferase domain-containing protein [Candidatus Pacearchaeota archaeon]|nr:sulfotransferase domain-containing protein [Candidatus Pacearchaeota archaeon]